MIPGQAQQFFEAAAAQSGGSSYEIERSLRFNSGDSAYLNKTLSSGNRRTWTLSFWVKRAIGSTTDGIFCAYNGSISEDNYAIVQFGSNDRFYVTYAYANYIQTNREFRDPSSWYHIVVVVDTNNSTAGDRVQLYVNGVRETDFAASHDPDSGQELAFNQACPHYIGSEVGQFYSDCYYAEMHFVDGTALGPTDFGEFDDNNNWNAKEYSGSYGTNGFYLKFNDNSSVSALGTDSSGNSNTWTVNNLSVTAGKGNDSLIDTPTDYVAGSGNNGGNYCTLIPLKNAQTLSNGNLDVVGGSSWQRSVGSLGMFSGKYYWEYEITASNEHLIGVGPVDMQLGGNLGAGSPPGSGYGTELGQVNGTGANGSWSNTGGSTTGDIIGIAFDADNGNMYVYKNGSSLNGGIASHTGLVMPQIPVVSLNGSSRSGVINFGQRPFAYTPPTDYVSLCTTNLADPAIVDPSTAFATTIFTGNGSTQSITGLNFASSPDFVWIKQRNTSRDNVLFDALRGANEVLYSNATTAQASYTDTLNSFDSSGFTLGGNQLTNENSGTYVAWAWEAGNTTTTVAKDANGANLPGATCEYRANTTNGFSVVKVADPQSNEARVHGLGVAPDFFICKSTASADSWHTYWKVLGRSYYINLNGTGPATSSDQFGSQEPDSTYFYVKSNTGSGANKSGGMVYYLWNAVDQYSAFGEYLGNANADGPFVFTGFRPKWIVFKMRSGSGDWRLMDTSRDLINPCDAQLYPNNTDAESSSTAHEVDYLSNGFKIVTSHPAMNSSGQYYLYAAFAEHPFKSARAR